MPTVMSSTEKSLRYRISFASVFALMFLCGRVFSQNSNIPLPVLENDKAWRPMYSKCYELALDHIKTPPEDSPFPSDIFDEAFNDNIFQWDMIFMSMFGRYSKDFPVPGTFDNFYISQHESGYICREISEHTAEDFVYLGRKHTVNPPLFSWAEWETFLITGDTSRLKHVLPYLEKYVAWLELPGNPQSADDEKKWYLYGRRADSPVHQLFWNTPFGCGMDNTPRHGTGWVDMSSQMVIQYRNIAAMHEVLGNYAKSSKYLIKAAMLIDEINNHCWNEEDGFYYDVDNNGNQIKIKTIAGFWPLLAEIPSEKQAKKLISHLNNINEFRRKIPFPTLAANEPGYSSKGDYWKGSVWAPTNYMVIKGLQKYGYHELAYKATKRYLDAMAIVFENTGTVWENYMPDDYKPGNQSKPHFVGWTGLGPLAMIQEDIMGISINAPKNTITWRIQREDTHGFENIRMGNNRINLTCEKKTYPDETLQISASSSHPFTLMVIINDNKSTYKVEKNLQKEIIVK